VCTSELDLQIAKTVHIAIISLQAAQPQSPLIIDALLCMTDIYIVQKCSEILLSTNVYNTVAAVLLLIFVG